MTLIFAPRSDEVYEIIILFYRRSLKVQRTL